MTPSLEKKFSTLEELQFLLEFTIRNLLLNCTHGNYRRLPFIIMLLNCIKLLCLERIFQTFADAEII